MVGYEEAIKRHGLRVKPAMTIQACYDNPDQQ